jgi:hypothetical protein
MNPHCKAVLGAVLLLSASVAFAGDKDKPQKLTDENRVMIIRNFNAELVFARSYFPLGKIGIKIEDTGKVSPDKMQMQQLIADSGPAAKPGDRVKITNVIFKSNAIVFEINGGPVKKKKWYERVSVSGMGGAVAPMDKSGDPNSLDVNNRGSYVALAFKDYVPTLTTEQIKTMLKPVLDFNATNAAQAYAEAMPPVVQQAIKNHRALVGMDRDMVVYAMGRAPKKIRDHEGTTDYEEWIYGEPPKEVNFVRFVGDRVVRIETMKVDGEKEIRTAKEVDLDAGHDAQTVAAKKQTEEQSDEKKTGPSLMRPGEKTVTATPGAAAPARLPGGQQGPQSTQPGQPPNMPGSDPGGGPPTIPGGMPGGDAGSRPPI